MSILFPADSYSAYDYQPDTREMEEALPPEAESILAGQSPLEVPGPGVLEEIWDSFIDKLRSSVADALRIAGVILAAAVICSMAQAADLGSRTGEYIRLAGIAAVGAAAVSDLDSYLGMGLSTLETLSTYARAVLPTLTTVSAAAGTAASAAAKYAATAMFMDILLTLGRSVVMPAVCGYAALSIAGAAAGSNSLQAAGKLMKSICGYLLTGLTLCFTAWMSLTGIITGSADTLTARLTKTAVSAALPVVGSVLSDAAGTLAAAVSGLRGTIGVFGMLAVLCVCIVPFAALGARYIVYKLAAALCECIDDGPISKLVDALGTCFGMILSLNGVGALMMFLSLFSLIRTVTG